MATPIPGKVQDLGTGQGNGSTVVLTIATGLATTVGNMMAVYVRTGGGATLSSVTDSQSNTWTVNKAGATGNVNSAIATAIVGTPLANGDTITIHVSSAQPNSTFGAAEFTNVAISAAGVAAVDTAVNGHSTTSPMNLATTAAAIKYDLVLSAVASNFIGATEAIGATDSSSSGTWSQLASVSSGCGGAYEVGSNAVTQFSAGWTVSNTPTNIDACVVAFSPALEITTTAGNVPGGSVGVAYSKAMFYNGGSGTRTWSITGTGPPGLSFTSNTLSGTPTTAGTYSFSITVTDTGGNTASLPVSITIAATGFSITNGATLTGGVVGTTYSPVTLATTGGSGTVTFSLISGSLPNGIKLTTSGSGTSLSGVTITDKTATLIEAEQVAWVTGIYPINGMKIYNNYGVFPAPANASQLNSHAASALANSIPVFLCYMPTYWGTSNGANGWPGGANKPSASVISNELSALITSVNAHVSVGLTVLGILIYQEMDDISKHETQVTPAQTGSTIDQFTYLYSQYYTQVKKSVANGGTGIPLGCSFIGDNPPYGTGANLTYAHANQVDSYIPGPTQLRPNDTRYIDFIGVDLYASGAMANPVTGTPSWHTGKTAYGPSPSTAPHLADIADYIGIAFGWMESGNSAAGEVTQQKAMALYLLSDNTLTPPGDPTNSIQAVYSSRLTSSPVLPCLPYMWYENLSGVQGSNHIDPTSSDYRIGYLTTLAGTLNTTSGSEIAGKPKSGSAGTYGFTIQATDGTGATTSKTFSLTVTGTTTTLSINASSPPAATVSVLYQYDLGAVGGTLPYTWSKTSGSLPGGISLDTDGTATGNAGALYGTPTAAGSFSFNVKVTDSASNTATASVSMTVAAASITDSPYLAGAASAASGGSATLQVALQTSTNPGDSILVGVLVDHSAVTASVTDTQGNTYTQTLDDTTETAAQLYVFESDGATPLSVIPDPVTGDVDYVSVTYSATTSNQAAIVVGDNGVTGPDKGIIAHGSSTAPSSGSSGTLTQAEEHAISFIVDATAGGAPTWGSGWSSNVLATQEVPSGPYISAAFEVVNATTALTAAGTITSAAWTASLTTLFVSLPALSLTLADGVEGDPYSQTLTETGGVAPYTWSSSGSLPDGLTLSAGVISGTPTAAGEFTFTLTVTDTNSATSSESVTVTILSNQPANVPSVTLPSNLLSPGDCDFESGAGSWVSDANASSITTSANVAVTGDDSLMWSATAAGATAVHSGAFAVTPGEPYIVSGYIMPCGQRDTQIGLNWYDNTSTLISQQLGPDNPSDTISWQPVEAALTAPSNAATARVVALVQEASPGDVTHLDTVYVATSKVQILIDWVNPPFTPQPDQDSGVMITAAGSDFMDVSPWVRLDQNITYTRGRQDMISDVQPGSASFYLQNDQGMFTRFRNESLPAATGGMVSLQCRTQINLADDDGNWWTRFDGQISEIDYTFDQTGNTSLAQISLTDILGYLNRTDQLPCWTKSQILADMPQYHWTLDDPGNTGGSGVFAESSGNNGPPLRLRNDDGTDATIAYQDTTGGVETLADAVMASKPDGSEFWPVGSNQPNNLVRGLDSGTVGPYTATLGSVYLVPKLVAQSAQNQFTGNKGYFLQAQLPVPIAPYATGADSAVEIWFTLDPGIAAAVSDDYGPYVIASLGTSREGECIIASIYVTDTSQLVMHVDLYNQPPAFLGLNYSGTAPPAALQSITYPLSSGAGTNGMDNIQIPHHLVLNIQGDASLPLVTAYLDNNQFTAGLDIPLSKKQYFDTVVFGGAYGGTGCHWGGIQLASVYGYQLTQSQITNHCMLGQYGMWEQTTDDCIAALATLANIPDFWNNLSANHNGLSLTDYQDITSFSALTAMQTYEVTEQGLIFADATGALNFHTRDWRMGYGAPDLYLPPESFDPSMTYQLTDQFMQNESAMASVIYPTGVAYTNQESQDQYGPYIVNSPVSPAQLPLTTFNRAEGQLGLPSFGLDPDPNLSDTAAWAANAFSAPFLMPGTIQVDLLTLDPNDGLEIADYYALEIDNMVAPGGTLPESFPDATGALEWFIEGITETIGVTSRNIQFYCSPATSQRAWIPGDPVYGVLGQTTQVGVSSTDLSTPPADGKDVSHDAGEPFWPPAFASDMNNPASNNHGFIGNLEMRGLIQPVARVLNPPMCIVSATSEAQAIASGAIAQPQIFWDTIHVDTESSMGLVPGWPNWYVCTVPGFYDIDGSVTWSTASGSNAGYQGQGWIVVARAAAQAVASGAGSPIGSVTYVCPVGESPRWNGAGVNAIDNPATRVYLGLGDMVTLAGEQNSGSSISTGTNFSGSHMSILWRGYGTDDDGCQFNTGLEAGGTVTDKPTITNYVKTYSNTHTYTYYGSGASPAYGKRTTGAPVVVYQASANGNPNESQAAQIAFPYSTISNDLNPGGAVTLQSISITGTNIVAGVRTGCYAAFGWSNATPGQSVFDAANVGNNNQKYEKFQQGQTVTTSLPISLATAFQGGNAKMVILGDGRTTKTANYGEWQGGPGSWLLTIAYQVRT